MTEWTSVEDVVRDALARLRLDLNGHHQVVDLSEHGEQRIRAAIDWLISVRHPDGYWGFRSPAVTATCTHAVGPLGVHESDSPRWGPAPGLVALVQDAPSGTGLGQHVAVAIDDLADGHDRRPLDRFDGRPCLDRRADRAR